MKININLEKTAKEGIDLSIELFKIVVFFLFGCIVIVGSISSLVLLYKSYPVLGIEFILKLLTVLSVSTDILKVVVIMVAICILLLFRSKVDKATKELKQQRINKREKFLDDLVVRLSKRGVGLEKTKKKR